MRLPLFPPIVARQRLGKHVPAATDTHAIIEEVMNSVFSTRSCHIQYVVKQK
jgi:hypothetical protein